MVKKYSSSFIIIIVLSIAFIGHNIAASPTAVLKKGMSGESVLQLQQNLKKLNFFKQEPTGFFGEVTESAVINFQEKNKLSIDGIAGPITLSRINALLNNKSGVKIVIDPGHGGVDGGAQRGNAVEKNINLDISLRLRNYLNSGAYNVVMTRNTDISLYQQSNKKGTLEARDLDARTKIIEGSGAKLFVSIHANSSTVPSQNGSIVYYNSNIKESKKLAESIQKELNSVLINNKKRTSQSIQPADFYILRNTNIPGVLVETGFLTNTAEREQLLTAAFRDKIASAVFRGIEKYVK